MRHIQLRAFHTVAREHSFSRAAEALSVTQPAVTLHVQALEETYGLSLFNRTRGGVTLTGEGAHLFELTTRMFAEEADIAEYLGGMSALRHGHLNIAADGPHVALDLVAEYRTRHPGIDVRMTLGNANETLDDVMNQRVDAGVLANPPDDARLHVINVLRQSMVCIVAATHPWAARDDIALADLAGEPVILRERGSNTRSILEAALKKRKIDIVPVMELGSREAVREAAAHGLGFGFMQEREAAGDARVVALPIRDLQGTNLVTLVCLKRHAKRRTIEALIAVARSLSKLG
ncbi:LysR substrate-binding domain-containing protein [Thalassospiraceae bacterium LMO-JJ14]|nr:LysR substrate-binding domain-containing protein [Thalassospiraceae bacterium LMO-JJ14]